MQNQACHHCGYDLTGLPTRGACPECGKVYDTQSVYRQRDRPEHPLLRHIKPIALGAMALMILMCGGLLSLAAQDRLGMIVATLVIAALPAFGAFVYWWSDRHERRGSD